MKFGHFLKALAPVLAVALAAGVSGCDGNISINGEEGKKLAEIDLSGPAPSELALFGPDEVQVTQGDKLAITVDGDPAAVEQIRFTLKDGTLGVLRADKNFDMGDDKLAVVHVTMPAPKEVTMAGSGKINAPALARDAKVTVLGSGRIDAQNVQGGKLHVTLPGSGTFRAAGNVDDLDLTILGSGSAELDAVKTPKAKVTIMGSGGAAFASDGDVDATIMGSGSVKVKGRATCKVTAMGSGSLVCENGVTKTDGKDSPEPPEVPDAPEAPKT